MDGFLYCCLYSSSSRIGAETGKRFVGADQFSMDDDDDDIEGQQGHEQQTGNQTGTTARPAGRGICVIHFETITDGRCHFVVSSSPIESEQTKLSVADK